MKNHISNNLLYLVNKMNCSRDEFGTIFGLNRGNISFYINETSQPKIETIQKICEYFKISIDDFINRSLEEQGGKFTKKEVATNVATNVETATKEIAVRDELIAFYKEKVERMEKEAATLEILSRIESKIDASTELNKAVYKELEEQFEYLNLKENLEKAKSLKTQQKSTK